MKGTKISILISFWVLFHPFLLFSQGEWNLWYFGDHTGLDFNLGVPFVLSNNAMYALGTTSSVADSMGNLLFYSDGIYVYNRSHILMPNGSWLFGYGYPFGQGVFAVQMINYDSIYYLFTLDAHLYPDPDPFHGLRYSVIDMRLDNQKGDIIPNQKNRAVSFSCAHREILLSASGCLLRKRTAYPKLFQPGYQPCRMSHTYPAWPRKDHAES